MCNYRKSCSSVHRFKKLQEMNDLNIFFLRHIDRYEVKYIGQDIKYKQTFG